MSETPARNLGVYKTKWFARFARRARINDGDLWRAALAANAGVVDADLGGGIVKQRVPRKGEGKSGGSRAFIVIRRHDRVVYVFGFEKKDQANISSREWEALKKIAKEILGYSEDDIAENIETGELVGIQPREEAYGGEV